MKAVRVYQPKCSVILHKTVLRSQLGDGIAAGQRFSTLSRKIDLTPYLGEGSVVRTQKSVKDPAGAFTIMIPDKGYTGSVMESSSGTPIGSAETVYALVEPQDMIEIRMRHDAGTGQLPIVMRGFVSNIARQEGVDQVGRPVRSVTIIGQDYGKLWQQLQINYLPGYVVGEDTLTAFKLFERFGVGFQTAMKVGDFVSTVVGKILDPYLQGIVTFESGFPTTIVMDADQLVQHGTTSISGPQNKEGTIWELLRTFCDIGAWNELFLEDRDDGVYCVFRPNPYKHLDGSAINSDSVLPPIVEVHADDISSLNVSRSDRDVANYVWVRAPRFEFVSDVLMRQDQALGADSDTVLLGGYVNTSSTLYGWKLMHVQTEMGGDDVQTFNSGLKESDNIAREALLANWQNYRRRTLVDANKNNVVLEQGTARLRGNEALRAGSYLRVFRGSFSADYYVPTVMHDFTPYRGFFTTAVLERGTGFVERAKRGYGSDSPYYGELSNP